MLTLLFLASALPHALAYQRPGVTVRVSVTPSGVQSNGDSQWPSVSADGRYVAFPSLASNLVPGDTNGAWDVFVHDRGTQAIQRVSVTSDGQEGDHHSEFASISTDGRYVAFHSFASNLVPGDTNGAWDVFVHDRQTGETERVSVASDGTQGNGNSLYPSISADGRYVAFTASASNLVPGDTNGEQDVFVHDRDTGMTERVSVASDGSQGSRSSASPSISADGQFVAFDSLAPNLVPGDTNEAYDVFVHDREAGLTQRVSLASGGAQGNDHSWFSAISADGRFVGYQSSATNLVPSPPPPGAPEGGGALDVFLHDRQTGTTERVSVTSGGEHLPGYSAFPSLSDDGRFIAFQSSASFAPGIWDMFVRDRVTGTTELVSVGLQGGKGNSHSYWPSISASGRYVAFYSLASNLVPGDTNGAYDIFVRDRGHPLGVGEISAVSQGHAASVSGWATFSGTVVASATDPPDDGLPGAEPAGAELVGATIVHRSEQEDLLVRLDLASLPAPPAGTAARVLYGLQVRVAGVPFEVRALRGAATSVPPSTAPYFALYRCDPVCTEDARLAGGIGTTGSEVLVSVPLSALGASGEPGLTQIRAFTALGEAATGTLAILDEVDLPPAELSSARVSLGIAPDGTAEEEVAFAVQANLVEGRFSGTVDASSFPPGGYLAWARACLGTVCVASSTPISLG